MPRRMYSGNAAETALSSSIDASTTLIPVDDATGYPSGDDGNFWIVIDRDLSTEEKILCNDTTGNTITAIDRTAAANRDDTSNQSHSSGAKVEHVYTADDADDTNRHVYDTGDDDHTQYLNEARHTALSHAHSKDIDYWRWVDSDMRYGPTVVGTNTTIAPADDTLYAMPFLERRGGTLDELSLRVTTGFGGGNAHIGIYSSTSDTNLYPDALVVASGALSISTSGTKSTAINEALDANTLYWLVIVHDGGGGGAFQAVAPLAYYSSPLGMAQPFEDRQSHIRVAFSTGALPATFPGSGTYFAASFPVVAVRYSA